MFSAQNALCLKPQAWKMQILFSANFISLELEKFSNTGVQGRKNSLCNSNDYDG